MIFTHIFINCIYLCTLNIKAVDISKVLSHSHFVVPTSVNKSHCIKTILKICCAFCAALFHALCRKICACHPVIIRTSSPLPLSIETYCSHTPPPQSSVQWRPKVPGLAFGTKITASGEFYSQGYIAHCACVVPPLFL